MSVVLATAGFDHKIRFWEAPSGVCSRIIKFPDSQINRCVRVKLRHDGLIGEERDIQNGFR